MEIAVVRPEDRPGVAILRVVGEIDSSTADQFRERLVSLIDETTRHLIVNFAHVAYINSSGLGGLIAAFKRVRASEGSLRLCNVGGAISEVMKLIRLDNIVDIYDTEEAALASLDA